MSIASFAYDVTSELKESYKKRPNIVEVETGFGDNITILARNVTSLRPYQNSRCKNKAIHKLKELATAERLRKKLEQRNSEK